jgi:uncharacterized membrane protein YkoI
MRVTIKNALLTVAALTAFALGGAAVAGAVTGGTGKTTAQGTTTSKKDGTPRANEQALTGDTAAKVKAAALAASGGGTVDRLETDGDGHAAYEAHITKADGSRVTVYVDKDFKVVSTEAGRGGGRGDGGGRGHGHGAETALTGDAAAKVSAAALAKTGGGTVDRVENDADGHALYEAHITKADGTHVTVYVDKDFNVVSVESR